jgi:hypothetical protein
MTHMIQIHTYKHTTKALSPNTQQRYLRYSSKTPTFNQNKLAMGNTAVVFGGKPVAVLLQSISISGMERITFGCLLPHGGKGEVLFYY